MTDRPIADPSMPVGRSQDAASDGERLAVRFRDDDALRSRCVSAIVHAGRVDIAAPPMRLVADWAREIATNLQLEPGDVEPLSLPRARTRWPDFRQCVQAVSDWLGTIGLRDVLAVGDIALMACRGARYHHDAARYGGSAFCNLFLSENRGLEVHFPVAGRRIALTRGTVLLFDTGQPHAVVPCGEDRFDAADFAPESDRDQVFLSWELPIDDPRVARALGIVPEGGPRVDAGFSEKAWKEEEEKEGLRLGGAPARLCPTSGRFLPDEDQAVT